MCGYTFIFAVWLVSLFYFENDTNILYRSPKELHFRDYSLPEGVSSVVPSGVNNLASHHCKCYLLTIVCRILCVVIRSTHINHLVASGFMKTSYTLRSLGYPMPPPLVLECKFFGFYISDVPCALLYN